MSCTRYELATRHSRSYDDQRFDGLPRFEAAADRARSEDRGVWGRCGGDFHSAEPGTHH